ncbi:hypothetical protein [Thioalkalivibrio sp.]|uniref:hypothetical protein n=1 Tax=Thioalkalivibrio sp. TaxID=2093813 RepID=UPI003976C222
MTITRILGRAALAAVFTWGFLQPAVAAALSERAESVREAWLEVLAAPDSPLRMEGELDILERPDGSLRMVMDSLVLRDPSRGEGVADIAVLELGTLTVVLHPVAERRWQTEWEIPGEMRLRDGHGNALGVLEIDERALSGLWAQDLGTMLTADLRLGGLALTFDADAIGADRGSVGKTGDSEGTPGRIQADRLQLDLQLAESEPGVVSGPLAVTVDRMLLEDSAGELMAGLGGLRIGAEYRDVDLVAISAIADLAADPDRLAEQDPEALLAEALAALGGFETTLEIVDLSAGEPGDPAWFSVGAARLESAFAPSAEGARQRDLRIGMQGRDWHFADGDGAHRMDAFTVDLRLDRITPDALFRMGLLSLMADELPAEDLIGLTEEGVGSIVLGASLNGIGGRVGPEGPDAAVYGLELLEFGLSLLELDTRAPGLALSYRQRGLSDLSTGLLPIPREFIPRELVLDLSASGLPAGAIVDHGGAELDLEPGDVFRAMLENRTRLDVNAIVIDLPITGLRLSGNAHVEEGDAGAPESLHGRSELEIRNLDTLIEYALAFSASEAVRQQILAVATVLKLAAEERSGPEGEVIHYLRVEASSRGELLVNGTDIGPLLIGGGQ